MSRGTAESRFWSRVSVSDDCWLWTGATTASGYGVIRVDGRQERAHRYSLIIHGVRLPPGAMACHRCDVRSCVRPDHLFVGDQDANMADMVHKGRSARHERNGQSKLTMRDAETIRSEQSSGVSYSALARRFGVSKTAIKFVVKRKSWRQE